LAEIYCQYERFKQAKKWAEKYKVTIKKDMIDGINVYYLTPLSLLPKKSKHLFVYLHGGAYIFGGGMSGLLEGILIASRTQIPVIAIDYRMPPDYPFPTAIEDTVKVYRTLLKSYDAKSLAMGGSSSGGGLALATVHKLKSLNLALPGALFIGTPWSDLTKSGDSLYVNEGIDRKIVTYDGFITAAAKLYANGANLKEPGLSPVYGDFSDFPPTMLVTGTRDLFLSLTVRVHRKMKAAGVTADLNVYEGLSHVEYFVVPEAPESIEVYSELKKFLGQHLK
jgi:acetyl esterase/lipase